jgi:iron complex outermembrane receptor protein
MEIVIRFLLILSLLTVPLQAVADVEFSDELEDEFALLADADVVELAARHKQDVGMSPSAVTVITREDIEATGANSIPDLLRLVPGMGVVTTTPVLAGPVGRLPWGNDSFYYLILIDGREANFELLGFTSWPSQPIFLDDIERIEIIRGPASSLYGANAVAGVINVTTRAIPEETSAWAGFSGGEAGYLTSGVRASARFGDWGVSLSAGIDHMGLYADPRRTGIEVWKLRSVVEYRISEKKRLILDAGVSNAFGSLSTALGVFGVDLDTRTVRLAFQSEELKSHVYWTQIPMLADMTFPLDFQGIRLANFVPANVDAHIIDAEVQWQLPEFWQPLLAIAGATGRASWAGSDQMLDAETFTDPGHALYRQPGLDHWEWRIGAFLHTELTPVDWMTITGGLRLDYNTETQEFLSPRLAVTLKPAESHFLRLGATRAFRKPAFLESRTHPMVSFPATSPIQGTDQDKFLEFMTRVLGNADLRNEDIWAFEIGYLGRFLDGQLTVGLELYYNLYLDEIYLDSQIVIDNLGLPDLDVSNVMSANSEEIHHIIGSELSVRYDPTDYISLLVCWSNRQILYEVENKQIDETPQNLITVGGRFKTPFGLVGSLFAFSRSEFTDRGVLNPGGILEPALTQKQPNVFLVLGKLGWRWKAGDLVTIESGLRLFLPVSFDSPHLRFREEGGGTSYSGEIYGGVELARMITGYLQGQF